MRIMLIAHDQSLALNVKRGLKQEGHAVDIVQGAKEAVQIAQTVNYDLIVVDSTLPTVDGVETCRTLRDKGVKALILLFISKDHWQERINCYESGADDCVVKPFVFQELMIRIRTLFRRVGTQECSVLRVGDLVMDTSTREIHNGERQIKLNNKEYAILEYFMRYPNKVISRASIEHHVWNLDYDNKTNLIDVYIGRLRKKIDTNVMISVIETIKGVGYRLKPFEIPAWRVTPL